jgi:hypothetical protein
VNWRFLRWLLLLSLMVGLLITGCAAKEPELPQLPPNAAKSFLRDPGKFQQFNFIVSGHIYGAHGDTVPHPAQTLIDHLPELSSLHPLMFVSLGDIVVHTTEKDFLQLENRFLSKLDFPVFNTVGNHDVEDRMLYENRYGRTDAAFRYGPAYFIFLDTQADVCKITGDQQTMLQAALERAVSDLQVRNIFVFMHNVVFFNAPLLAGKNIVEAAPNAPDCYNNNNYSILRDQYLQPAAAIKPVFLFAGDVGAWGGNLSPFYEKSGDANLTTIATGIGDTPQDSLLVVSVDREKVAFKVMGLAQLEYGPLEQYNRGYWGKIAEEHTLSNP